MKRKKWYAETRQGEVYRVNSMPVCYDKRTGQKWSVGANYHLSSNYWDTPMYTLSALSTYRNVFLRVSHGVQEIPYKDIVQVWWE